MNPTHPDLLHAPLDELLSAATSRRNATTGTRITYSPKVFIPLTHLCRDKCGYCTFAQPPARVQAPYLSPDEVLAIARAGADAGCHEALFTLGERPEERYPIAREWLAEQGYASTVEYLVAMCRLVVEETGLLPHANAGALDADDLGRLREATASQGMMLESLNPSLAAHLGSPDKTPARRLATLEAAGILAIPFTTGILCGIGESRQDRIDALVAIAESHGRHGHVQEVIVQNFLPKPGTSMHQAPPCSEDDYLWSVAVARLVLPADIHLQAPPNLSDDFGRLLDAGIDDWGGVSPVTPDHVNPERPWPAIDRLRLATEVRGMSLAPRLTIYPEFVHAPTRWLDPAMGFPVMDHSDAEGLAREPGERWYSGVDEDPPHLIPAESAEPAEWEVAGVGSASPPKKFATRLPDLTTEVQGPQEQAGNLVANFSGGEQPAAERQAPRRRRLRAERGHQQGHVNEILEGVLLGQKPGIDELVTLFSARGPEVVAVAEVADQMRREIAGDVVTFVRNRNINYTNVCTFKCKFCAFSKGPLSLNLRGTPYLLEVDEITRRVAEAEELGATEVCLQGGIHPSFDGDYYIDVIKAVREASATIHIHGFTALEVTEGAKRLGEPLDSYLRRLMDAGLKTLPGTAAEILDDEIRAILCPDKVNTEEWLHAHRTAHSVGLRSNITIMFGSVEAPVHWARHLIRTRDLQEETGGFTEFVPLPFVHMASPIYLQRKSRRGPTFRENLLMHAVGRIAYGPLVPNVQVSWVKIGASGARQILQAGANDLGGTLMDENISRAAGAAHGQLMDEAGFHQIADPLGRPVEQRTTLYGRAALVG